MSGNLKLDANHDIIIGRGTTRVGGVEYVAQLVKCRLLTLLGEWQQDSTLGLPWYEVIFTKDVRDSDIQVAVANIIRSTNHVRQLLSIDIDADRKARILTINFVAISDYGNISEVVEWRQ
ncbi:putative baseplate wedge protein [Erwinia phage Fifi44]|uniref:Baseplate wedge protein n=1 Tax=Erwinia phage Fifi44 TaxID=2876597 RepID=A0AAE9BZW0_9CAUD|nr:putative baseplate wedge protein [Erwinia phage Fifi44]QQV88372.1 putative baseplate wedge protein [Erwinia phage pEa_SNUABM_27]UCR74938.1 putative baseplate wedge protein [Erwinia phage Fifi44]UCR80829.1 putative baseplate wedge protein [Erwinia phage Fifi451]WJN63703.1 baseplate wedge protein [Erwinia phage Aioli]